MNHVQLTNNPPPRNPPPRSDSADLFDSADAWINSPDLAFLSWLKSQPVADSTRRVRASMWRKFMRYLDSLGVKLAAVSAAHVSGFVVHAALEKEQAWRYVKLIERVYVHLNALGLCDGNPARSAGQKGVGNRQNDPMRFLSKKERQNLIQYLLAGFREAEVMWAQNQKKKMEKAEYAALWAGVRDGAVAAVLVGAGVKVRELCLLSVNCTSCSGVLVVPRREFDMERRIILLPVAVEALRVWMLFREPERDLGRVLFPALVSRRRDDQRTLTSAMHPSTVFRRVSALLNECGIRDARACGQTLRNTFAASLIESGADDATIIVALGYKGEFTVPHLRMEYESFLKGPARD